VSMIDCKKGMQSRLKRWSRCATDPARPRRRDNRMTRREFITLLGDS
jgi:hypothetical protein